MTGHAKCAGLKTMKGSVSTPIQAADKRAAASGRVLPRPPEDADDATEGALSNKAIRVAIPAIPPISDGPRRPLPARRRMLIRPAHIRLPEPSRANFQPRFLPRRAIIRRFCLRKSAPRDNHPQFSKPYYNAFCAL